MLITFNSMGYDYISKICFDFLKRIIPHSLWDFTSFCSLMWYSISRQKTSQQLPRVSRQWQPTFRTPSSQPVI